MVSNKVTKKKIQKPTKNSFNHTQLWLIFLFSFHVYVYYQARDRLVWFVTGVMGNNDLFSLILACLYASYFLFSIASIGLIPAILKTEDSEVEKDYLYRMTSFSIFVFVLIILIDLVHLRLTFN